MSPAYFFDKMTSAEISEYIDGYEAHRREKWEMTRSVVHGIFQSQSGRRIERQEVMIFPWDEQSSIDIDDSCEAREALIERAKMIEKQMQNEV